MFKIIQKTIATGIVTTKYPGRAGSNLRALSRAAELRFRKMEGCATRCGSMPNRSDFRVAIG